MDEVEAEIRRHGRVGLGAAEVVKEPLLGRWWVPFACGVALIIVWTPESYKIQFLRNLQKIHEYVQFLVHSQYWRMTMNPQEYEVLMKQIQDGVQKSKRVKSPDCPL